MSAILDVFLAQPFGSRSLMQRIFSLTLHDGIRSFQKSIDSLDAKIGDETFTKKLHAYTRAEEHIKTFIREESESEEIDLIVAILRSDALEPELTGEQIQRLFNAYVAFNNAVENIDEELRQGAQLFSYLKQLLKLCTRQRDKEMMLQLIEEPVTLQLFRDLFTIFYEPLVRVYKSANVYNSVTDFAVFIDDIIQVSNSLPSPIFASELRLTSNYRLWTSAGSRMPRPTPTRLSRPSLTCVSDMSTTSTSLFTRSTSTTTGSSRS